MWFRILFLLLTFSLTDSTSAQLYILKGKITDAKSGSPIQAATVLISYNYAAYSNAEGFYSISED